MSFNDNHKIKLIDKMRKQMIKPQKILVFIFISLMSIILIFFFALPLVFVEKRANIGKVAITKFPKDYDLAFENILLQTSDGIKIAGWYIPVSKPKGTMILCHGLLTNRGDILKVASYFYQGGYEVYMFDFRNHGDSDITKTTYGYLEHIEVKTIVQYLKKLGKTRIGIWGLSMGGAIALMSAPDNPEIKIFIIDSSYASLENMLKQQFTGNDNNFISNALIIISKFYAEHLYNIPIDKIKPINNVKKLNRPILFISGTKDHVVSVENSIEMYNNSANPKEIYLFKNVDHRQTIDQPAYKKVIIDFCNKYLK